MVLIDEILVFEKMLQMKLISFVTWQLWFNHIAIAADYCGSNKTNSELPITKLSCFIFFKYISHQGNLEKQSALVELAKA